MIFQRKLYEKLLAWKSSKRRKPLVLRGARQVGKSTLIREFAKEYGSFVELNLEKKQDKLLFELDDVKEIIEAVSLREAVSFVNGATLLFIDEIQESPIAIKLLRFFYEDFPDIHVICAGSLLEHAIKSVSSFPVGRIQQLVLHPFDFEEFLLARGMEQLIKALDEIPIKEAAHIIAFKQFQQYAIIGGMPEVVKTFVERNTFSTLKYVYEEIWLTYKDDVEKYGRNETEKKVLRHIIDTAPYEPDRVTMAGFGNSNYKSREVGEALRALDKSRLIQLVYPGVSVELPLEIDFKRKPRLQFLDVGLLNYSLNIQSELIGLEDLSSIHKGRLIQQIAVQQIQSQDYSVNNKIHFWVREKANSSAEVDIIYHHNKYLIPVEVKSGAKGRLRSLHEYMDRTNHHYAIRLLANKLSVEKVVTLKGKEFILLNLPYYLSIRLKEYTEWLIRNY